MLPPGNGNWQLIYSNWVMISSRFWIHPPLTGIGRRGGRNGGKCNKDRRAMRDMIGQHCHVMSKSQWEHAIASARALLLKGKAQFSWPPCSNTLFCKQGKYIYQFKKRLIWTSWYKEVNRTGVSTSVRIPCINIRNELALKFCNLIEFYFPSHFPRPLHI